MSKTQEFLAKLSSIVLVSTAVLVPLLIVPVTANFVFESKYYMFLLGTLVLGTIFAIQSYKRGAIEFVLSPFTWPLVLFGAAALASSFFANVYPVESLLGLGGIYIMSIFFILFGGTVLEQNSTKLILPSLAIAGSTLTILTIAQLLGFGPAHLIQMILGVEIDTSVAFNAAGSPFFALQLIGLTLLGLIAYAVRTKYISKITAITAPILIIGLILHVWAILPGRPAEITLPNWTASWSVALDTIRTPREALIGVGPEAYVNVYSRFKPAWVNTTEVWAVPFAQGASFPLTVLTTMGFLGLITWAVLAWAAFRMMKYTSTPETKALSYMLAATFIIQLLLPVNVILLFVQALCIMGILVGERHRCSILMLQALAMQISRKNNNFDEQPDAKNVSLPVSISAGVLLIGLLFVGYLGGRTFMASAASLEAAKAMEREDAETVYTQQQRAITLNPYLDVFRRDYASTNILIAIALSDRAELTQQEQETVAALLQQAIREARAATVLDPLDSQNWIVLAQIYQNMIGAVEEADQWTVQAYVEAINTNPTDPSLRIALGGIFLNAENYQQAYSLFEQAANLKPDMANAYYNMAFALIQLEAYLEARQAYLVVLELLDPASEEYAQIQQELEELEAQIPPEQLEAADSGEPIPQDSVTPESNPILDQNLQDPSQSVSPQEGDDVQIPTGTTQEDEPAAQEDDSNTNEGEPTTQPDDNEAE
ncbi:MAG: hypothetical protein WDZ94_04595 [Patescibacteria group bacterium]